MARERARRNKRRLLAAARGSMVVYRGELASLFLPRGVDQPDEERLAMAERELDEEAPVILGRVGGCYTDALAGLGLPVVVLRGSRRHTSQEGNILTIGLDKGEANRYHAGFWTDLHLLMGMWAFDLLDAREGLGRQAALAARADLDHLTRMMRAGKPPFHRHGDIRAAYEGFMGGQPGTHVGFRLGSLLDTLLRLLLVGALRGHGRWEDGVSAQLAKLVYAVVHNMRALGAAEPAALLVPEMECLASQMG